MLLLRKAWNCQKSIAESIYNQLWSPFMRASVMRSSHPIKRHISATVGNMNGCAQSLYLNSNDADNLDYVEILTYSTSRQFSITWIHHLDLLGLKNLISTMISWVLPTCKFIYIIWVLQEYISLKHIYVSLRHATNSLN